MADKEKPQVVPARTNTNPELKITGPIILGEREIINGKVPTLAEQMNANLGASKDKYVVPPAESSDQ